MPGNHPSIHLFPEIFLLRAFGFWLVSTRHRQDPSIPERGCNLKDGVL